MASFALSVDVMGQIHVGGNSIGAAHVAGLRESCETELWCEKLLKEVNTRRPELMKLN